MCFFFSFLELYVVSFSQTHVPTIYLTETLIAGSLALLCIPPRVPWFEYFHPTLCCWAAVPCSKLLAHHRLLEMRQKSAAKMRVRRTVEDLECAQQYVSFDYCFPKGIVKQTNSTIKKFIQFFAQLFFFVCVCVRACVAVSHRHKENPSVVSVIVF